jgi:hypothetical protein
MIATMCIYNYIHENHALDKDFRKCNRNPNYVQPYLLDMQDMFLQMCQTHQLHHLVIYKWIKIHDDIARAIFFSR